jgi:Asp-tRNA(Asn)/Glu-tRNA(Gln) amidotransferase A subunit family amidase
MGRDLPVAYQRPALDVTEKSIRTLQQLLSSGEASSAQLVTQYLNRINAYDDQGPQLNTMLSMNADALQQAQQLDAERQQIGPRSLLHGIPVVIKDNYNTTDMATTGASVSLADFVPNQDATQVTRLRAAGAIILGKTNLHEFAYGITSVSSLGGQTRNPYDPRRVPGGSSGGTAAAVAANFAATGMGSDTCGSIRIPAAFNNLVGLRPTKGLSSIYGIMPLSHTQDVAGPLARSIEDLAIVLDLTAGYDPLDIDTAIMQDITPPRFVDQLGTETIAGLRIGRLSSWMDAAEPEVSAQIDLLMQFLAQQGATIVEVEMTEMARLLSQSGLIGHEFETDLDNYLQQFDSNKYHNLEEIVAGGEYHEAVAGLLSRSAASQQNAQTYQAALAVRSQLQQAIITSMAALSLDVIAYPPIASLPALIGQVQPGNNCSLSANSGFPALSIPAGFSAEGLPVGLELLGLPMSDTRLLAIGYEIEKIRPQRRPALSSPALP